MKDGSHARRRGSAYVLVIGTALMVAVITLSAATAMRLQLRSSQGNENIVQATLFAQSAVQMGMFRIRNDPNWRTTYAHDTWQADAGIGSGTYTWKLVDEENGSLTADLAAPVRIFGRGTAGNAVRTYSVLLEVRNGRSLENNLLVNGDMEEGVPPWTCSGLCYLEAHTDDPHGGLVYLWVKNRESVWVNPGQEISGSLTQGTQYEMSAWVKLEDFSESVSLAVWLLSYSGWQRIEASLTPVDTTWTYVEGTFTPTWVGTLIEAWFKIETDWSDQEFMMDDVMLFKDPESAEVSVTPLTGTWRREVGP